MQLSADDPAGALLPERTLHLYLLHLYPHGTAQQPHSGVHYRIGCSVGEGTFLCIEPSHLHAHCQLFQRDALPQQPQRLRKHGQAALDESPAVFQLLLFGLFR